jgi:hypothetical protein
MIAPQNPIWVRLSSYLLLLLLLTIAAPPPGSLARAASTPPPPSAADLPPRPASTLAQARPQPKLDAALAALAADQGGPRPQASAAVQVQISIAPESVDAVSAAIAAAGGEVTISSPSQPLIQAWLPSGALESLATHPQVQLIRRPAQAVAAAATLAAGAIQTEGLALMNGQAWQAAGHTGRNLKVAVVVLSLDGLAELPERELPRSQLVVLDFVDPRASVPSSAHGAAVAEVIHDIAPEATIYLARISTLLELEQAVVALQAEGVTVITNALHFFNEGPGDGTGFVANLAARARSAGMLWVAPAGDYRMRHWAGEVLDRDGDGWLGIGGTREINWVATPLPAGVPLDVFVRWSDWASVDQDFELVLLRWDGSSWAFYASSDDPQFGMAGQTPTERIATVTSGATTYYGVALYRHAGDRAVNVDLFTPLLPALEEFTPARSLASPADAPAALTVAGIDSLAPYAQEWYSAEGPLNAAGGTRAAGILKPDLAAYAGVSTFTYGFRNFRNTDSSAAHVVGAALLLASASPSASVDEIQRYLEQSAIDRWYTGQDTRYGHGQLFLGRPPLPSAPFDIDPDGKSDVLWWKPSQEQRAFYQMDGTAILRVGQLPLQGSTGKLPIGVGDFDGDGAADQLWFEEATRRVQVQITADGSLRTIRRLAEGLQVAGVADFNADGTDDLLIRDARCGCNYLWLIYNSSEIRAAGIDRRATEWLVAAVGDFNGDARADILWKNTSSGRYEVWQIRGLRVVARETLTRLPQGSSWQVRGVGDFDGDGSDDLLWQNSASGWVRVVFMRAGQAVSWKNLYRVRDPNLRIVAVADYQGDGKADILWRAMRDGGITLVLHNGAAVIAAQELIGASLSWQVIGAGITDGRPLLEPVVQQASSTPQQAEYAPGDPSGPVGANPIDPDPGPEPLEPDTEDTAPPDPEIFAPIDDLLLLSESVDLDALTEAVLAATTIADANTIYLPLLRR